MNAKDLSRIIARHLTAMRRFARALTGNAFDADDLVQIAAETAIRKRRQLRQPDRARSWLMTIVYRAHLDLRRQAARREAPLNDPESAPVQRTASNQDARLACAEALDALDALPAEQRAALTLVAVEGHSTGEAARILGVKEATLRSQISRARSALREAVDAEPVRPPVRVVR
ncbi:RNA polymerase sigma factor [Alkalicaulis satelles]|uniref:RNA polymerase sigma factor n=1 Tax=Alkalicaulis satelles TaxID=2609175 RepID=A0A5M6ZL58_9PROT|nr:RNA polymerase sigma factor [Alkalicaulis satelles]KAA5804484.1 RNA polymerase sigma factor [Alkalicaulis satelles]